MENSDFMKKRFLAFTLAEVLITLGIIGVVAALVIPLFSTKFQNKQYVAQLKRNYSVLNESLEKMANDAGCPGDLRCFFDSSKANTMGNKISAYFKTAKTCQSYTDAVAAVDTSSCNSLIGIAKMRCINALRNAAQQAATQSGCSPVHGWLNPALDSGGTMKEELTYYRFVAVDGASYDLYSPTTNCSNIWNGSNYCMIIMMDINGFKPPNRLGRDYFYFYVKPSPPFLGDNSCSDEWKDPNAYTSCADATKRGTCCAARIIEEGWEMKY